MFTPAQLFLTFVAFAALIPGGASYATQNLVKKLRGELRWSPWTLGVSVHAGDTGNVISKNDPLTAAFAIIISTMEDNQSTLSIDIYEDSPMGHILGTVVLTNIAPAPAYVPQILVKMWFGEGWDLHVEARDDGAYCKSGFSSSIVIDMQDRLPMPARANHVPLKWF